MTRTLARTWLLRMAVLLAVLVAAAAAGAARAGAVTYGLGDAPGTFARCAGGAACCYGDSGPCPPTSIAGYWNGPAFRSLAGPLSRHRITEVRLFVDYDAISEWNGSVTSPGCRFSRVLAHPWTDAAGRVHPAGESWTNLLAGLTAAGADGLTPVVSISGYGVPTANPSWDQPAPDPTTLPGYWEYRCGVQGLLGAVAKLPAAERPHAWEALNEPDQLPIFKAGPGAVPAPSCAVTATGAADGPAKAACAYVLADREIHGFAGHSGDTVIAGTFGAPTVGYLDGYAATIARELPGALYPATWSVHDYGDVTASYAGPALAPLQAFDQALSTDSEGAADDLWVTETGTLLTDRARTGDCAATGADAGGTVGACVSGQPARQASTAAAFFALPSAGTAVPITHLFWYQWQGEPYWDSGLVDTAGTPRVAWCAFYGSGSCTGDPNAA